MKKLLLRRAYHRSILIGFKGWLKTLGYASTTVYNMPIAIQEYLHYLEKHQLHTVDQPASTIRRYIYHLQTRNHARRDGLISAAYINKHIQALHRFSHYLRQIHGIYWPISLRYQVVNTPSVEILSKEEIAALYESASDLSLACASRAMTLLDIFYACGLRRSEGVQLELSDVRLDTKTLFVRYGKKGSQRKIPFTNDVADRFQLYVDVHRQRLIGEEKHDRVLVNQKGKALSGQGCLYILRKLQEASNSVSLREKKIGLHSLRHSIATHLLASGMDIYLIQKFLGHVSLESTQIYTHLLDQIKDDTT